MKNPSNRRRWRNLIINPSFQMRLVLLHIFFVLLVGMAVCAALWWPVNQQLQPSERLWEQYASAVILLRMTGHVGLAMAVVLFITSGYFIIFSHRLCGPLVNFDRTLDRIAQGDLTRSVHLRKKDFLKEQAARINDTMACLCTRVAALKQNQMELDRLCGQLPDGTVKADLNLLINRNRMLLDWWTVESGSPDLHRPVAEPSERGEPAI